MKKNLLSLLTFFLVVSSSAQVFQSGFDANNGPISLWTMYNVDGLTPNTATAFVNNAWVASPEEFDNNIAISNSWYTPAGVANDWMVTPAISLPAGTNILYWQARAFDATYPDSYRVLVSTTGNQVANFTTEVFNVGNGTTTGENTTWTNRSVDLSAFSGQTIHIAFRNYSNDMFLLGIDNVYISNGAVASPPRATTLNNITLNSGTFNWTAADGVTEYEYSIGAPDHVPAVTGTTSSLSHTITGLSPNSRTQYYIRSKGAGALRSAWIGPYSLFTAVAGAPSYAYGFDAGAVSADGWSGTWSRNTTPANPQAGAGMMFSNNATTGTTATNRWLVSRPIHLEAGSNCTITFWLRNFGTNNPQTIRLFSGATNSVANLTNQLWSTTSFASATWAQQTVTFTPPTTGTYYFGFQHNSPVQVGGTSLALDTFELTSVLSVNDNKLIDFSVYPNPVNDILVLRATEPMQKLSIIDLNGRVLRTLSVDEMEAQINVSELNSGVYFIQVDGFNTSSTKKFIKN